jgi:mono/diheme cytochrome c family protein
MQNLVRKRCLVLRMVSGRSCLFIMLVGLVAFRPDSLGQSAPASAVGPTPDGSHQSPTDPTAADQSRARPFHLFRTHCIECHDSDGRGEPVREIMSSIPDFTKPDWHQKCSDDRLVRSVKEGKGAMPAMKAKLSETDVVQLVSLVREFRGARQVVPEESEPEEPSSKPTEPKAASASRPTDSRTRQLASPATNPPVNHEAAAGRGIYTRFCAACHGADGHGSAMRAQIPSIPDFTSPAWQQRRNDPQLTTTIFEGKGTGMPTFRGKLDESQARNLVAYLRAFAPTSGSATIARPTEFKLRFQQLTTELDDLKRQYQELSKK